jgi:hypothetical protein
MGDVKVKACCYELQKLWNRRFLVYSHGVYMMEIIADQWKGSGSRVKWDGKIHDDILINNCPFCGKSLYGLYETSWKDPALRRLNGEDDIGAKL